MKQAFLLLIALAGLLPGRAAAQTWPWAVTAQAITGQSYISAMATDGAGNTVVAGTFLGTLTLGSTTLTCQGYTDIFVARLNAAGQWTQAASATGAGLQKPCGVALNPTTGEVTVAGYFASPTLTFGPTVLTNADARGINMDIFVARLSAQGVWTQAVRGGGFGQEQMEREGQGLVLDAAGNAVVAGTYFGSATFGSTTLSNGGFGDVFVARLSPQGTWVQAVSASSPAGEVPTGLALAPGGDLLLTGTYYGASIPFGSLTVGSAGGGGDVFVARLNAAGQWTQAAGAGSAGIDNGVAVAADGAGNLVVAGTFGGAQFTAGGTTLTNVGSANTEDVFVARYSAAGQWTQAVRGGGPDRELVNSLVVDANGTANVVGNFFSAVAPFGAASLGNANPTSTTSDVFVAQLSPAGQWTRALRDGGPNSETPVLAARLTGSDLLLAGTFYDNTILGGRPLALAGWGGPLPFAGRLSGFALASRSAATVAPLRVWPNPAHSRVALGLPVGEATVRVFDACGREVRRAEAAAGHGPTLELSLEGLSAGIYVLRCGAGAARLQVL